MSGYEVIPGVVEPATVLARARADSALRGVADKLIIPTKDIGTPDSKIRLGWVDLINYDTWLCRAYIGDQTTPIPNLPIAANARPVQNAMGVFVQVGNEYTLIGMLMRDQVGGPALGGADFRVRKPVSLARNTTSTIAADPDLRFWAQAGRSYLVEVAVILSQTTTNAAVDFKSGFTGPSGFAWSGGGHGPDIGATTAVGNGNWAALVGAVGSTLAFGPVPIAVNPVLIVYNVSVTMGTTSGYVSFAWSQNASSPTTDTTVHQGSFLKADVTGEITA